MVKCCLVRGVLGIGQLERGKELGVMGVVLLGYECEMVFGFRCYPP